MKKILKRRKMGSKVARVFGLSLFVYSLLETLGERAVGVFHLFGYAIIIAKRK